MKKIVFLLCILLSFFQLKASDQLLKIGTYNVRIDVSSDTATKSWSFRKEFVASIIKNQELDIVGIQELFHFNQENELKDLLSGYNHISKGRDNSEGTAGERLAIFYKKDKFELLDQGFFFLSETPDYASKGWDAALNRICMWAKFRDIRQKKEFYVFNTHFDHVGTIAREKSAQLITERIESIRKNFPVFCLGDFNASSSDINFYSQMTRKLSDSKNLTKNIKGSTGTFNGWEFTKNHFPANVLIDYIFVDKIKVINYKVITDKTPKQSYPSDHFPVVIHCKLK